MRILVAFAALFLAGCGSASAGGCPPLPADRAAAPSGCLRYSITPDARTYPVDAAGISFEVTATNVSTQPCAGPSILLCGGPGLSVFAADGKQVWARTPPIVACPMLIRLLQPGESMSAQVAWTAPRLAVGAYSVVGGAGPDLGRSYFLVC